MADIGRRIGHQHGKPFLGWVVVSVGDARRMGRDVEESPLLGNMYHADIVFPSMDVADARDHLRDHAYDLARHAEFREAPSEG